MSCKDCLGRHPRTQHTTALWSIIFQALSAFDWKLKDYLYNSDQDTSFGRSGEILPGEK